MTSDLRCTEFAAHMTAADILHTVLEGVGAVDDSGLVVVCYMAVLVHKVIAD